ncbi:hypothetical protein K438DRAFT_1771708 [Mycena galopus ATCC 62051]|nr:hypothetical protein K438DRAFT_1771708 [Mycena galopus ATCC 62051]
MTSTVKSLKNNTTIPSRLNGTKGELSTVKELPGASTELTEGQHAYAAEHTATEHACCANLERRWAGILAKADAYLNGDVEAVGREGVTVEVDLEDELDPEEEEAWLEGEEEDGIL